MKAYAKKRMLKTADEIEAKLDKKHFNMYSWRAIEPKCGTVFCIGGFACQIPAFKRTGLKLDVFSTPVYNSYKSFMALAKFYDISHNEASVLFNNDEFGQRNVTTPKGAAKRLRDFVKSKERAV